MYVCIHFCNYCEQHAVCLSEERRIKTRGTADIESVYHRKKKGGSPVNHCYTLYCEPWCNLWAFRPLPPSLPSHPHPTSLPPLPSPLPLPPPPPPFPPSLPPLLSAPCCMGSGICSHKISDSTVSIMSARGTDHNHLRELLLEKSQELLRTKSENDRWAELHVCA